jgi:hypothetical protein
MSRAIPVVAAVLLILTACAPPSRALSAITPVSSPSGVVSTEPSTEPTTDATTEPTTAPTATPTRVPLLQITSAVFHTGEVGVGYAPVTLAAAGGAPPLRWSISVGALPGGLSASSGGSVSGTPTAAGTFSFTVRVDDSAGHSATVNRSIAVVSYLSLAGRCSSSQCVVEVGCTTVCGTYATQAGGVGPFTYVVTPGYSLPPGMSLNGLGLNGPFPPEPVGAAPLPWKFQVTVTDSLKASATVAATFHVVPHLAWVVNSATCTPTTTPLTCTTTQLSYSGGIPGTTPGWKVVQVLNANGAPEPPPPGFTVSFKSPTVIVTVPPQQTNYYGVMTLILTDPSLCAPATACPSTGNATVTIRV